ncbi:hypothetical protein BJ878DRAFT_508031 [Calycina marina]|uniref:F-box domain-containing protein n=1 Tax=Calycina marina TaxID=1763456 RepID=A0A9P8CER6_9HELO|nr:hypothetical protein BJ878DRAFT_508031 [Calycina marina]
MPIKRRRSSVAERVSRPSFKKIRTRDPLDFLSILSDEILIRILHNLPIETLLLCQQISHRLYMLAGDSQIWKNLYYNRFVLPRALRIPGIKAAQNEALHFSSQKSRWLGDNSLLNRSDGQKTNWKRQYKLRHNWAIGACIVQEIHVAAQPSVPAILVRLAERIIITADKEEGLRAWDIQEKSLVAQYKLGKGVVPTCLAIDELDSDKSSLGIAVGFVDGSWNTLRFSVTKGSFSLSFAHPASSNGSLGAIAFSKPYLFSITDGQLLSLYTFGPKPVDLLGKGTEADTLGKKLSVAVTSKGGNSDTSSIRVEEDARDVSPQPHLLASLKSHTSWPPLSLSIRSTPTTLIASIAYSLPTYLSGYTIGLQELHLSMQTSQITSSRLTTALSDGFQSLRSSAPPINHLRPTSLSYSHPYILATHPDNTLTFYMCTSTATKLSLSHGTKLWGHTSCVSSAEITPRGKAVSVSTRGELRVWDLEGGVSKKKSLDKGEIGSVRVAGAKRPDGIPEETFTVEEKKQWVGFDDEMVIVLKDSGQGTQALVVYDFT